MHLSPARLALCLLIAFTLNVSSPSVAAEDPVVIPTITSLTGGAAFIGAAEQDTLKRFETAINRDGGVRGRPVHFEFYDDESSPSIAVQLYNEIVAKKAQLVLGPTLTNSCLALIPFVQEKTVQYCLSPGVDPPRGSYIFSANTSAPDILQALIRYFHTRGWTRIATLTTSDATGQQIDQRIDQTLELPENKGLQIVDREHFAPSDLTVTAQVAKIKSAKAQAVIVWVIGTPFLTALRALSDAGDPLPVAASNSAMTYGQMRAWGPYLPSQLYFSGTAYLGGVVPKAQTAAIRQFFSVTKDAGLDPDFLTGLAWDPALVLVAALRRLGPDASAERLHAYIEQLRAFPGIYGVYDFTTGDQRGLSLKDLMIMRWDAKAHHWLAVSGPGGAPLK